MIDSRDTRVKLEDIPTFRDFSDVFPKDLSSILIVREDEFGIDIMPGIQPISKAPY